MSMEKSIRFELLARLCPNTTGAELRSVCTEAGNFIISLLCQFYYIFIFIIQECMLLEPEGKL